MNLDFSECKGKREKEALTREAVQSIIYNALVKACTAEKVAQIDESFVTQSGAQFTKDTIIVEVAELMDTNNCQVAPLAEISVKIRTWNSNSNKAVFFDDILDYYEQKEKEKEGD